MNSKRLPDAQPCGLGQLCQSPHTSQISMRIQNARPSVTFYARSADGEAVLCAPALPLAVVDQGAPHLR
jgi:hypothetical protein